MQNGAVMNTPLQPHESHIPYLLQFFIDYNIYGMDYIELSHAIFKRPLPPGNFFFFELCKTLDLKYKNKIKKILQPLPLLHQGMYLTRCPRPCPRTSSRDLCWGWGRKTSHTTISTLCRNQLCGQLIMCSHHGKAIANSRPTP